jgi:C4-dicarboxylate-specific signal transduction histidine kinase
VTERREAELEVQQHRAELAHVMRVAVMGELTSSLAHELNQPLAAILNYANAARRFLSADEPDLDRAREALKGITRDDKRAGEVIRKVRNMLKRDDPSYVALDINNIVQETVALVGWDLSFKGASVTMDLARDLEPVMGDRVQLQQVLLNLVMNAVVAMRGIEPELRKLVIKTDKHEERSIRVSVSDTGHGIAEAQRHLIFEPFYTTKRLGLGMGLAISQRIINAFGGAIWAENDPHGGATVSFTIPVVVAGENRGDETIVRKPGAGAIYE